MGRRNVRKQRVRSYNLGMRISDPDIFLYLCNQAINGYYVFRVQPSRLQIAIVFIVIIVVDTLLKVIGIVFQSKLLHECSEAARILETSMALHSSTSSKARRNVPSGATVASEVTEHLFSISSIVKALPKAAIEKTINEINKNDNLTR